MAVARLVEVEAAAAIVLGELMLPGNPPLVRLRAASTVLAYTIAAMARLGQLERPVALPVSLNGHAEGNFVDHVD